MTEKRPAADLLTDVAYFVEDDDGNLQTVYDGEVIHAELVDEPESGQDFLPDAAGKNRETSSRDDAGLASQNSDAVRDFAAPLNGPSGSRLLPAPQTAWLPKVPELNPRRRTPNEPTPIFDELDRRRLRRKSWTKANHDLQTTLTRTRERYRLEELAHRNRVWEIEHASPLLNQLRQP